MVRKKDKIWEHVEELQGNKWKCKFYQKVFSGGAYRIKAHLSGITGHDVEICSKVNHETQACAFLAMSGSGSNKKLKSSAGSSTALMIMRRKQIHHFHYFLRVAKDVKVKHLY